MCYNHALFVEYLFHLSHFNKVEKCEILTNEIKPVWHIDFQEVAISIATNSF